MRGRKIGDGTIFFGREIGKTRENGFKWGSIDPMIVPKLDLHSVANMKFNVREEKKKS